MRIAWSMLVMMLFGGGVVLAVRLARDEVRTLDAIVEVVGAIARVTPPRPMRTQASPEPPPQPSRARRAPLHESASVTSLPTAEMLVAHFCAAVADRVCGARARCGCMQAAPDCRPQAERACREHIGQEASRIAADALELDPRVVQICLDGFERLGEHCDVRDMWDPACGSPIVESVGVGQTCHGHDTPCRGGRCANRRCIARDAEPWRGECVDEYACPSRLTCRDGHCVPRPIRGQSCDDTDCGLGLICVEATCSSAPTWCEDGDDCGAGSLCSAGRCEPAICEVSTIVSAI